ncbi:MAG: RNA helicase, partial [Gammaproteobacteria bacterium]|nr:RNA helicase [Gammaproteobacteria bacterium]
LGFIKDVRYMLRRMPPASERLNMLFSATLSLRVTELAYEHMNAPQTVDANPPDQVTVERVTQQVFHVSKEDKIPLLLGLMRSMDPSRTVVFTNTKRDAERVARYLIGNDIGAALLTGDVPQRKRLSLLERFKSGELQVLVATDVAARGLHIDDVSHVINYDLPQDPEDYVHRVGRTARAGQSGDAISFGCESYVFSLPEIEEFIGKKIPVATLDPALLIKPKPPAERIIKPRADGPRGSSRHRSGGAGDGSGRRRRRSGGRPGGRPGKSSEGAGTAAPRSDESGG